MSNNSKSLLTWFVTLILPILAVIVPVVIYVMNQDHKELSYEIQGEYKLINDNIGIDEVEIKYRGDAIKNLELISFRLTNTGGVPIKAGDFEREIKILFSKDVTIYSVKNSESYPTNLRPKILTKDNHISISPLLLNPDDYFSVEVILSGYDSSLVIDARISGISKIIEESLLEKQEHFRESAKFMLIISIIFSSAIALFLIYQDSIKRKVIVKKI